jgi:hypothetical protein
MDNVQGARTTSKNYRPAQADVSALDATFYEARITNLFIPWLVDEISDGAWQILQEKLKKIIQKIISKGRVNK